MDQDSKQDITIIVKRSEDDASCFSHFRNVRIDGKLLEKDKDYTAVSGSTIVTVKAQTLEVLADGRHTITLEFDDGTAETSFTIAANDSRRSPDTSDPGNMIWLFVLLASLAVLAALRHMEKAL